MTFRLDYFYGKELCHFLFYRTPKILFETILYRGISFEAKMFFSFLLDRMTLSAKCGWIDELGRVYIFYKLSSAMSITGYGHNKVVRIFAELEKVGLIERVRQGQGKPVKIYVKNLFRPMDEAGNPQPMELLPIAPPAKILDGQMNFLAEMEAAESAAPDEADMAEAPAAAVDPAEPASIPPETKPSTGVSPAPESVAAALSPLPVSPRADNTLPAPAAAAVHDTPADPSAENPVANVENVENSGKFSTLVDNCTAGSAASDDSAGPASFLPSQEGKSRLPETGSPDFRKSEPIHTEKNKTDFPKNPSYPPAPTERFRRTRRGDWWKGRMDEIERCRSEVRFQIGYNRLAETHPYDMEQVDDYVDMIVEVLCSRKEHLYVSREDRPIAQVRSQFEKLTYEHMDYILDSMRNCTTAVTNVHAYMLSTLYNAPNTIRAYYDARVRHDMAQDDWWDNPPRRREARAS